MTFNLLRRAVKVFSGSISEDSLVGRFVGGVKVSLRGEWEEMEGEGDGMFVFEEFWWFPIKYLAIKLAQINPTAKNAFLTQLASLRV
jgi:hypothetical protein